MQKTKQERIDDGPIIADFLTAFFNNSAPFRKVLIDFYRKRFTMAHGLCRNAKKN